MQKDFSGMLRELRKQAGLSQEALARKANLSLATITKLEQGRVQPSWETVKALAEALGTSCQAFEQGEFAPAPKPRTRRKAGKS
jgi:transcriptional regulator with XRE-family HTH domain